MKYFLCTLENVFTEWKKRNKKRFVVQPIYKFLDPPIESKKVEISLSSVYTIRRMTI